MQKALCYLQWVMEGVRGRGRAQAEWLFNKSEGVSGKGRRPAAPQLQTREKQKGFQEGPALRWLARRAFQRQGGQGENAQELHY